MPAAEAAGLGPGTGDHPHMPGRWQSAPESGVHLPGILNTVTSLEASLWNTVEQNPMFSARARGMAGRTSKAKNDKNQKMLWHSYDVWVLFIPSCFYSYNSHNKSMRKNPSHPHFTDEKTKA